MKSLHLLVQTTDYPVPCNFVVTTSKGSFESMVKTYSARTSEKRQVILQSVIKTIKNGNDKVEKNPELVGTSTVWANLMADCAILVACYAVEYDKEVPIITDEMLAEVHADPKSFVQKP